MARKKTATPLQQVSVEQNQGHQTRQKLFVRLEKILERPLIAFFTSFDFPVMIDDGDADMLVGQLQDMDLSKGLALLISSPGGDSLAAERIVNICRSYSKTGDYWAIVPGKAKSAATMICFGASKILMAPTSELGPVDPQVTVYEGEVAKRFSACNIVDSYEDLFTGAVKEKGNLEPYLQQLANYDQREIKELKAAIELSEDIAVKTLSTEMMKGTKFADIKKKIDVFLSPKRKKTHGRPIYRDEALKCDLVIENIDVGSELWKTIYELYIRIENFVSVQAAKCIESRDNSNFLRVEKR